MPLCFGASLQIGVTNSCAYQDRVLYKKERSNAPVSRHLCLYRMNTEERYPPFSDKPSPFSSVHRRYCIRNTHLSGLFRLFRMSLLLLLTLSSPLLLLIILYKKKAREMIMFFYLLKNAPSYILGIIRYGLFIFSIEQGRGYHKVCCGTVACAGNIVENSYP